MEQYKEYKDSGVKWIGKIPRHWGIESFGRHFSYGKGLLITKADLKEYGVAVISYGQIHAKNNTGTTLSETLTRRVDSSFLETNPQCLLEKNDFIFAIHQKILMAVVITVSMITMVLFLQVIILSLHDLIIYNIQSIMLI